MRKILFTCICILAFGTLKTFAQKGKSNYKIVNKFAVEGDGGWDYLTADETKNIIFVSHSAVTQVIDCSTGKLIGTISDTKGVHGIAIAESENKIFISCGKDSTVTIADLNKFSFIKKIKVTGANPDAILYDKFSNKVFAFNGRTSNVTVIDAHTDEIISTMPLEGKPEFSVSDGKGKVYVNIEDKSMICEINSADLMVEANWPVAPGEEPSGIAIDNETHRLFAVCDNKKMIVVDATNGKIISNAEIGSGVDGCAFDTGLKRIYSSNGEGTLTIVQEENGDAYKVLDNFPTQKGARTICVNSKTHHLYLPTASFGEKPAATDENPHPRPKILPGTFIILDIVPQ